MNERYASAVDHLNHAESHGSAPAINIVLPKDTAWQKHPATYLALMALLVSLAIWFELADVRRQEATHYNVIYTHQIKQESSKRAASANSTPSIGESTMANSDDDDIIITRRRQDGSGDHEVGPIKAGDYFAVLALVRQPIANGDTQQAFTDMNSV